MDGRGLDCSGLGGFWVFGGWVGLVWVDKEGYLGVSFCVVVFGGVEWREVMEEGGFRGI